MKRLNAWVPQEMYVYQTTLRVPHAKRFVEVLLIH
jgi:hypothetical protein